MAADVLAYRADEVPVGDDQRQHVELMRESQRFNARFGETLVVPEHRIPEVGARIMDLQAPTQDVDDPGSTEGTVHVLDEPAHRAQVQRAVTDSGQRGRRGPEKPGIANLIDILAAVRGVGAEEIERDFADARYGDFKGAVAAAVTEYLAPVRERYAQLREDEARLEEVFALGAERAREIARGTLVDVRALMGVGPPR